MTSRQRLRRSAAVPSKLLNLLVRRFSAAVCAAKPPYPYALRGAFGARRGRMESRGGRERTLWNVSRAGYIESLVRRWRSAGDDTVRPPHP